MKKKVLFSILILASLFFGAKAQEFNAGVYGGMVMSQLDGDTFQGYNKVGLVGGAYVNRFATKKLGWQMGLRYIRKGSKHADTRNSSFYASQLQYVEMPISVRYFIRKDIDLEGGMAFGYLLKAMENFGDGYLDDNPPFNKFELSGLAGVNYHWNKQLSIGAFFSYSLLPVRPFTGGFSATMDKGQYNNLIYLAFCYTISSWK